MSTTTQRVTDVITVDGYNRRGQIETVRIAKTHNSRLVSLRRYQNGLSNVLADTMNSAIPEGMSPLQWRALKCRCHRGNLLPPVDACDYDVCPCGPNEVFSGDLAWLVGGNVATQLTDVPNDGFFNLGIEVTLPADPLSNPDQTALANAGIDVVTSGENRVRIYGAAQNDPEYQSTMAGKVIVANAFIETEDAPAEMVVVPTTTPVPGLPAPGGIADIYLERPSNVYNVLLDSTTLGPAVFIPAGFPVDLLATALIDFGGAAPSAPFTIDALNAFLALVTGGDPAAVAAYAAIVAAATIVGIPAGSLNAYLALIIPFLAVGITPGDNGVTVLVIANFFLGDAPAVGPTTLATFDPDAVNVQPDVNGIGTQIYQNMGLDDFEFLLKLINEATSDVAVFFGVPPTFVIGGLTATDLTALNSTIYSNANVGGAGFFLIPAGGAGFFNFRVDNGVSYVMLYNVEYESYTEPPEVL